MGQTVRHVNSSNLGSAELLPPICSFTMATNFTVTVPSLVRESLLNLNIQFF